MAPPAPRQLSLRQARQLMDTAYLAAATALLWVALYYLPVVAPLFRLALPLPLALLQLRHGWRCALEGVVVLVLLVLVLIGPIRGALVLFPYGLLALWLGWSWRRRLSWWTSLAVAGLLGTAGFLVRLAVLSLLLGENLWVLVTTAATEVLERLLGMLAWLLGWLGVELVVALDIGQVQAVALVLLLLQNLIVALCLHAVAYWIFPRLQAPIGEPPEQLRALVALDPL